MEIIYGYVTDKGSRHENQDSLMISAEHSLKSFGIADGMGGLEDGSLAGRLACEAFSDELASVDTILPEDLIRLIQAKYRQVNSFLFKLAAQRNVKLGTTYTMLNIAEGRCVVSNAGDTRIYLLRNGIVSKMTVDHTGEQLSEFSTADEERKSILRNALTMALGVEETLDPFLMTCDIRKGDLFVLCSDGLYKWLDDSEFKNVLDPDTVFNAEILFERCRILIRKALANGSGDNISVIAVKVQ